MCPADNRHTQIDMLGLAEAEQLISSQENARLQDVGVPGQVLQKKALNEKRVRSAEQDALQTKPETDKTKSRPDKSTMKSVFGLRTTWESPWEQYEKIYDVDLAGPVAVAVRKTSPIELVHVRAFTKPEGEKALYMFRHLQHQNIVIALDAFATDEGLYVILEHMPVSL